jgi:H+/Cl- antiporter ClcA
VVILGEAPPDLVVAALPLAGGSFGGSPVCEPKPPYDEPDISAPKGDPLMGIGLGVILVVIGAVLMWALNVNLSFVDDNTLGLILFIVGIVAIILSLIMNAQRRKTTHVEERRFNE